MQSKKKIIALGETRVILQKIQKLRKLIFFKYGCFLLDFLIKYSDFVIIDNSLMTCEHCYYTSSIQLDRGEHVLKTFPDKITCFCFIFCVVFFPPQMPSLHSSYATQCTMGTLS